MSSSNIIKLGYLSVNLDSWEYNVQDRAVYLYKDKYNQTLIAKIIHLNSLHSYSLVIYTLRISGKLLDLPDIYSKMFYNSDIYYHNQVRFDSFNAAKNHCNNFLRKVEKLKAFL